MLLDIILILCLSRALMAQEPTVFNLPIVGGLGEHGIYGSVISVDATGTVFTINCPTPSPTTSDPYYYPNPDETCVYPDITLTVNLSASKFYVNFAQPPVVTANNTCMYITAPTPDVTCTATLISQLEKTGAATATGEMPMYTTSVGVYHDADASEFFAPVTLTAGLDKLSANPTTSVTDGTSPSPSMGAAVGKTKGVENTWFSVASVLGMVLAI